MPSGKPNTRGANKRALAQTIGPAKRRKMAQKLSEEDKSLKKDLEAFFYTNPLWNGMKDGMVTLTKEGAQVPITKGNHFKAGKGERDKIQNAGRAFGCHTCNKKTHVDRGQTWIGDHIPPVNLSKKWKKELFGKECTTYLLAQCDVCAKKQSKLVNDLNAMKTFAEVEAEVNSDEDNGINFKLIRGGRELVIEALSDKVGNQTQDVQQEAAAHEGTCHSCPTNLPSRIYHADHLPPVELQKPYMKDIIAHLNIAGAKMWLENPVLRPQCQRCSNEQGGDAASATRKAKASALEKRTKAMNERMKKHGP